MPYHLKYYPEPVLFNPAIDVKKIDDNIKEISQEMFKITSEQHGIGLAANQIGLYYNMFVVNLPADIHTGGEVKEVFINPTVIKKEGVIEFTEGCLSCPGVDVLVTRSQSITLSYKNLEGEERKRKFEGVLAIVIQHELEHLAGETILKHTSKLKRKMLEKKIAKHIQEEQNVK